MNRLTVMTRYGAIEGDVVEDITRFRSIPYSDRIDGRARFAPPQPPRAWSGTRSSSEWAPLAPQVPDGFHRAHVYQADYMFGRSYPQLMTEGGLYLNLWTPSIDSDAKRPVLVWLHGGGFRTGVPTRPREDPALICKRGDLVVVTPTHRLGAFGYAYLHGTARHQRRNGQCRNVGHCRFVGLGSGKYPTVWRRP
jgi:para-nitrobenzyl esterase